MVLLTGVALPESKKLWSKKMTFADISQAERLKCLEGAAGQYLRKIMPPSVWEKFFYIYMSGCYPEDTSTIQAWLSEASEIFNCVRARPSDAYIFNYLYRQKAVVNDFDRFFLMCRSAQAIHKRLIALRQQLPWIISFEAKRQGLKSDQKVLIDNIGSGDALESICLLIERPDLISRVHFRCIDNDPECLRRAQEMVVELGLSTCFEFVCADSREVESREAHIGLLIGVLCPVSGRLGAKIVMDAKRFLGPKGIIIFSTVQQRMIHGDPLCDLVMRLAGWQMAFKAEDEANEIARAAGLVPESFFDDSFGYNRMTIARQPNILQKVKNAFQ